MFARKALGSLVFGVAFGLGWKLGSAPANGRSHQRADLERELESLDEQVHSIQRALLERVVCLDRLYDKRVAEMERKVGALDVRFSAEITSEMNVRSAEIRAELQKDLDRALNLALEMLSGWIETRVINRILTLEQKLEERSEVTLRSLESLHSLVRPRGGQIPDPSEVQPQVENTIPSETAAPQKDIGLVPSIETDGQPST